MVIVFILIWRGYMKKVLSLTFAFIVISASLAFAAETKFEGEFRIQSWSEWNFDKKANDIDKAQYDGWFEQRFRLTITHTTSEYLKAVVQLDLVEDTWGQGRAMRINNASPANPWWREGGGEYINQAYLMFTLPDIGTFRVGKFPISWGHGVTISTSEMIPEGIEWSNTWGPLSATLLYCKVWDNVSAGPTSTRYNRDGNLFALHLGYAYSESHLFELFGGYYHDDAWRTNTQTLKLGFVGIAYTGNFADMIDVKIEGSYFFGSEEDTLWMSDFDVSGWSIYADVSYYNDLMRIGLAFLMKSGGQASNDDNFVGIAGSDFTWGNIIGSEGGGLNSIYPWHYMNGMFFENITSVKLYFEICPMDKLTINAAVIWARFTEDVGPNSYYPHPADAYPNPNWGPYSIVDSKDLGWEVDLGFSYEIMEGLTYTFAGGVLFTGDAWDYNANPRGRPERENWGEIWSVTNTLTYEF